MTSNVKLFKTFKWRERDQSSLRNFYEEKINVGIHSIKHTENNNTLN